MRAGDLEIGVGGGMESMSNAPYLLPGARFGFRMGDVTAIDAMTHDGLTNPFSGKQMINEASEVSNELEITRVDLDRWAKRSHRLAAEATDEGRLADEIVAVTVKSRKGESEVGPTRRSGRRHRSRCSPACARSATRTPPTPPATRPASTMAPVPWWLPPRSGPRRRALTPLATILSYGTIGDDFAYLARTPAKAAQIALEKIGKSADDVDLWEINEAFASVAVNSVRCSASTTRRSTSTAARSRSATRSAPPAPA